MVDIDDQAIHLSPHYSTLLHTPSATTFFYITCPGKHSPELILLTPPSLFPPSPSGRSNFIYNMEVNNL